jgi:hypothetical protein
LDEGVMKTGISGKEAARVAEDMAKPGPIRLVEAVSASEAQEAPGALVPSPGSELDRKAPPRVRIYDPLEEATLNAALAIIDSMQPRSELQALLAVEIIATGFAGLRFLRQSHRNMAEDFINVYGNYAIKLLRLQNEMIQTFDRYRRGNKQTVEVRHVHIHPGGQGVVGIINPPEDRDGGGRE